jgi:hypothetical protein
MLPGNAKQNMPTNHILEIPGSITEKSRLEARAVRIGIAIVNFIRNCRGGTASDDILYFIKITSYPQRKIPDNIIGINEIAA